MLVFIPPVCTPGFLRLSLRPVGITPSQLLLQTGSEESCHAQGMTELVSAKVFFEVKHF